MDFFFIFGSWRSSNRVAKSGKFYCFKCGESRRYELKEVTKRATVFFVPVYSKGTGEKYVECKTCHTTFHENASEFDFQDHADRSLLGLDTRIKAIEHGCHPDPR